MDSIGGLCVEEYIKAKVAGRDLDNPTKCLACFPGGNELLKGFKQRSHMNRTYISERSLWPQCKEKMGRG